MAVAGILCELIEPQTWSYQDNPYPDEQAVLDAWFAEYPPEEPEQP